MKTGYVNGSDLLLKVAGACVGHCTSHKASFSSETKERAVKPVASEPSSKALFKAKGVTGLSITLSADGISHYQESESGFKTLLTAWRAGQPVECACFERDNDETPYLKGLFVISNLDRTAPGNDDTTFTITLENADAPAVLDPTKITEQAEA